MGIIRTDRSEHDVVKGHETPCRLLNRAWPADAVRGHLVALADRALPPLLDVVTDCGVADHVEGDDVVGRRRVFVAGHDHSFAVGHDVVVGHSRVLGVGKELDASVGVPRDGVAGDDGSRCPLDIDPMLLVARRESAAVVDRARADHDVDGLSVLSASEQKADRRVVVRHLVVVEQNVVAVDRRTRDVLPVPPVQHQIRDHDVIGAVCDVEATSDGRRRPGGARQRDREAREAPSADGDVLDEGRTWLDTAGLTGLEA